MAADVAEQGVELPGRLSVIAAMTGERVIGRGGRLPWHLRSDLQRFKRLTMGHTLLMGRKTYESIGRPLPGRQTVVLSRGGRPEGLEDTPTLRCFASLDAAREALVGVPEVFCAGGGELFRQALPLAHRLLLTLVEAGEGEVSGDVHFPEIDWSVWRLVAEEWHPAGPHDDYPSTFRVYLRA